MCQALGYLLQVSRVHEHGKGSHAKYFRSFRIIKLDFRIFFAFRMPVLSKLQDAPVRKRKWGEDEQIAQWFSRKASAEDKEKYKKACTTEAQKRAWRSNWNKTRLQNVAGKQADTTSESKETVSEAWYKPFPMLVQDQGGLIDLEGSICKCHSVPIEMIT